MYRLTPPTFYGEVASVERLSDNASIPMDTANTDYAEYLKWLEAGNTPLPPDTQPE